MGALMTNGEEMWWTTPGAPEPEFFSSGETIAFDYGGELIESPTNIDQREDGTIVITAPVPQPYADFVDVSRVDASSGHRRSLEVDLGQRNIVRAHRE